MKKFWSIIISAGMFFCLSPIMATAVKAETAPVITTENLPHGNLGTEYSQTLTVDGTNVSWGLENSYLPYGLSINVNTGIISGMPTESGTYTVNVTAANSAGMDTKSFVIVIEDGDLAVSNETGSHKYSINNAGDKYLTITSAGTYTIAMDEGIAKTSDSIIVDDVQGLVKITLNGVNIDSSNNVYNQSALQIKNTGITTIEPVGDDNILKSGTGNAGLENNGNPLVIDGPGSLYVYGGGNSAGIGSGQEQEGSNITINNGDIHAVGGSQGAGIGGGLFQKALNIIINGGTVHADAGLSAAGIGGGCGSNYIDGAGDVTASVTINGGTVIASASSLENQDFSGGPAIGSGRDNQVTGAQVTINGGTVSATGYYGGAAIGEGKGSIKESKITLNGGSITAIVGDNENVYPDSRVLSSQPTFGSSWYRWRTNTAKDVPTAEYTLSSASAFTNSDTYKYAEFIPISAAVSEETEVTPGPFVVTFLDCSGNTVSVQKVPYQGTAEAPSSNYSNFTNITEHKDIKPDSCTAGASGYKVPNTADK